MNNPTKYLIHFLFAITLAGFSQENSISTLLKDAKNDTTRLNILIKITEESEDQEILKNAAQQAIDLADKLLKLDNSGKLKQDLLKQKALALNNKGFMYSIDGKIKEAINYYTKSLEVLQSIIELNLKKEYIVKVKNEIATALNNIGSTYYGEGEIEKALNYYYQSLELAKTTLSESNEPIATKGLKLNMANAYNNIGIIYKYQGNINKTLEFYSQGLKIQEEIHDKQGIAVSLSNIGNIYMNNGDNDKALEYYKRGLKIQEDIAYKKGQGSSMANIGYIYFNTKEYNKARDYFLKSLIICEETGFKKGIANSFQNIGNTYAAQKNTEKALGYYKKSLDIRINTGEKEGIASSLVSVADSYLRIGYKLKAGPEKKKNYNLAFAYADSSLIIAKQLGFPTSLRNSERALSEITNEMGNYSAAFEHYKKFIMYRDSIDSEASRKAIFKNQLNYEFEKKEAVIKEQQSKERAIANEKNRFQQIIIASVIIGLILVIIFSAFVFRTLRTTRKQKIIIEIKQKEILDSILYAKRIQTALMSNENYIEKSLDRLSIKE